MKNFFKKLAFVLALAMIVTAIAPAGKASAAAKAPSYKFSKKVLYLGDGDMTGAYGDTFRFKFNNAKGYTATWESETPEVATVDAESGKIQAVAVGTTTITATLTNAAGKAVELDATVTVKQNTEKIGFGSLAAVKDKTLAVGDSVKINVYRQVGTTKVWSQADRAVSTDWVKWTTSDASVATVKAGKVTAVAAGKATIKATAMQTEGNTAVVSAEFEVEVAAGLKSVAQKSANTVEATFAGDLSAVANKDNVAVFAMVGATKTKVVVKDVKFDAADKTKAIVTTYTDFAKDTEYVVEYADTSASFKGADLSKAAVKTIEITTKEAVKNEATEITVKAFNADGIQVPGSVVNSYIDLSADTSADYFLDTTGKKITFFNSGKTAVVKAVFHTYTYDANYKEVVVEASATINSVDKATIAVKSIDAFTVYNTSSPDFTKASKAISISDQVIGSEYKVAVKVTLSDSKQVSSTDVDYVSKFSFASSDETTLIVNGTKLYPVKEGAAVIVVKYGDQVIDAYTVTIGPKRVASDVTATLDRSNLSSTVSAADSIKLTVTTKDQYGVDRSGTDTITAKFISGPTNANQTFPNATGSKNNEFVFTGAAYSVAGTYQFTVKVGEQVRPVTFEVKDAGSTIATYQLSEANKNVDLALKVGSANNTDSKAFTMALAGYAANGYKVANVNLVHTTKAAAFATIGATGSAFYVEITAPSGKTAADIAPFVSVSGGVVSVNPIIASGSFVKAPTGTYYVRVHELTKTAGQTVDTVAVSTKIAAGFTLTDTQAVAVPYLNKTTSSYGDALTALRDKDDVIAIKIGDTAYNSTITVAPVTIGTGKTLGVVSAKIVVDVQYAGVVGSFVQDVTINKTINFQ